MSCMETHMETSVEQGHVGRGQAEGSKATQFRQGHPGRKKGSGRKGHKPSRLLRDMRLVYERDESQDRTPGQKALRMLLKDSPKEFISQLGQLERAYSIGL